MFSKSLEITEYNITDAQLKKLETLQVQTQKIINEQYPDLSPKMNFFTNIDAILRFLVAREFNTEKALIMWKNWVEWRLSYKPDEISEEEEIIKKQLEGGKLSWHKTDKGNRPCLYYRMKYHVPGLADLDNTLRFLVYMIEKGCQQADKLGSRQICVIYDRRGYDKRVKDPNSMKAMKKLIPILQDYYPERLHCYYVMGANWFFRAMFTIVKTFLSEKTAAKVKLLAEDKDLLSFFETNKLIKQYGGTSEIEGWKDEEYIADSKKEEEELGEEEQKALANEMLKEYGMEDKKINML